MPTTPAPVDTVQVYQAMSALARDRGAVNLSQGVPEPVYDAHWRAAVRAELSGVRFQYTPSRGLPALRDRVGALYRRPGEEVLTTSGCTESLVVALIGLAAAGYDEVVWLEPFYSYYPGLARIAGLAPRTVPIDLSGPAARLDLDALRRALAHRPGRTVLLLNSPHNPSGLVLTPDDWTQVLAEVSATGSWLLLDDAYRDFRYAAGPPPYQDLLGSGRAAVAGSVSKSFAATGVRLGWLLAPEPLSGRAENAHMHLSCCAPELLQRAAVQVIDHSAGPGQDRTRDRYRDRRDLLVRTLAGGGLRTVTPAGGHFVMALPARTGRTATDLAVELTHGAGVAPLPLDTFFTEPGPPWLRFSFAVPDPDLARACRRLAAFEGWAAA